MRISFFAMGAALMVFSNALKIDTQELALDTDAFFDGYAQSDVTESPPVAKPTTDPKTKPKPVAKPAVKPAVESTKPVKAVDPIVDPAPAPAFEKVPDTKASG